MNPTLDEYSDGVIGHVSEWFEAAVTSGGRTALTALAAPAPAIGIGAGPSTDGQVLVFQDLLGIRSGVNPRFVRRYAHLEEDMKKAARDYCHDVQQKKFPSAKESF